MTDWGRAPVRHPGHRDQRRAGHHRPGGDQPDDPDPARQLVLRRLGRSEQTFVTEDPLGNPVDKRHPWNKVTLPKPQKRDFADKYSWVVSPRIYDKRTDTTCAATPAAARSRASG